MSRVVLYGLPRSVYTRIAAMTLFEKGVSFDLDEVEIFGPTGVPASHFKRHPFGRIPVLRQGESLLYETQTICRYIDEAFDGSALQPMDPMACARMAQAIGILDSYAYRPMIWDVFVQRVGASIRGTPADEATIASAISKVKVTVEALASFVADHPYFGGTSISLADLHAYPMLALFRMASEGDAVLREHPCLMRWLSRMSSRDSAIRTRMIYESHQSASAA